MILGANSKMRNGEIMTSKKNTSSAGDNMPLYMQVPMCKAKSAVRKAKSTMQRSSRRRHRRDLQRHDTAASRVKIRLTAMENIQR